MKTSFFIIAATALVALSFARADAQDAASDPRLRVVAFDAGQVTSIEGHLGYQMMIEFAPNERIENVSIGDSAGWQVTPNHAATLLFLKPMQARAATNMIVVTSQRRYAFALRVGGAITPDDPRNIYSLRFTYPADPMTTAAATANDAPPVLNFAYASSGARSLMPARVFDDGRFTYFELAPGAETPAIFVLNGRDEEVVNSQVRGAFTVVDQRADAFVLRYGRDRVVIRSTRQGVAAEAVHP